MKFKLCALIFVLLLSACNTSYSMALFKKQSTIGRALESSLGYIAGRPFVVPLSILGIGAWVNFLLYSKKITFKIA